MPKITKTINIENGFIIPETNLIDYNEKKSTSKVLIPFKKVKEFDLKNKKIKVTIEVIE